MTLSVVVAGMVTFGVRGGVVSRSIALHVVTPTGDPNKFLSVARPNSPPDAAAHLAEPGVDQATVVRELRPAASVGRALTICSAEETRSEHRAAVAPSEHVPRLRLERRR